jgi:hypothetical protein
VQGLDFEPLETAARQQALQVAARALEGWLNADTSDHKGSHPPCACGAQAQYRGRHAKSFESVLGTLHLERAYYHCEKCQSGFCPRDRALGLEDFSLSPAVLRMVGSAATLVSFVESSAQLHELARVEVNAKQVERAAEALRQEIAEDECRRVEPLSDTPVTPTLYLGIDGTGIPMRAFELIGRSGKQGEVRPKPARSSSSPSGVPNRKTRRGYPCATRDRLVILRQLKVRRLSTPPPITPSSRNESCARRPAAASSKRREKWC